MRHREGVEHLLPAVWSRGTWSGERCRLLAGFVAQFAQRTAVEIGTHTGIFALCLLKHLRFWREMRKPKMDTSSLGHWTGTGRVRWVVR